MKDDTISRQAAINALGERPVVWSDNDDYTLGERNQYDMDRLAIETVPSAQPSGTDICVGGNLIDREAAIEAMRKAKDKSEAHRMLIQLPSAQPGWIPCSRELPKKDGDYLVTTHSGQIARYIFIGGSSEEYWRRCATAWMSLPTPYREGGRNA